MLPIFFFLFLLKEKITEKKIKSFFVPHASLLRLSFYMQLPYKVPGKFVFVEIHEIVFYFFCSWILFSKPRTALGIFSEIHQVRNVPYLNFYFREKESPDERRHRKSWIS